jgi:phage-related protein
MSSSEIIILELVRKYLGDLSGYEQSKIDGAVLAIAQDKLEFVRTKQLKGPVRELIIGHHRLIFFQKAKALYFVSAFRKKSAKTPKGEIEYAERIHKGI